jgi:hypothetical protein
VPVSEKAILSTLANYLLSGGVMLVVLDLTEANITAPHVVSDLLAMDVLT